MVYTPGLKAGRVGYARAASHAYRMGRLAAEAEVAGWPRAELLRRADEVLDRVELAESYAQALRAPFEEYLDELKVTDPVDADIWRAVYQAGFDLGFHAGLVECCARVVHIPPST